MLVLLSRFSSTVKDKIGVKRLRSVSALIDAAEIKGSKRLCARARGRMNVDYICINGF